MILDGFLVYLYKPDSTETHLAIRTSAVLGYTRLRLWRSKFGDQPLPPGISPSMVLHNMAEAPMSEPLSELIFDSLEVDARWDLTAVARPRHPVIELELTGERGVLAHGYYALDDVFGPLVRYFAHLLQDNGSLDLEPGAYAYDVQGIPSEGEKLAAPESPNSFDLEGSEGDQELTFRETEGDGQQVQVARALFRVKGKESPGPIRMHRQAWEDLSDHLEMPLDREVGGYLVGDVSTGDEAIDTVTIHHAVPAVGTVSSQLELLISTESGSAITRRIARRWPTLKVVGWYHTHVFCGTYSALQGLSEMDLVAHDQVFQQPWAVAGLVNVWRNNGTVSRQVRVYRRDPDRELAESSYLVIEGEGE